MDLVTHRADRTHLPVPLAEITRRIYARIDRFALDLGADLQDAYESHPDLYESWVERDLPFGLDTARRLRMIHKAAEHLPASTLERLPRPWQALYALTRLPAGELTEAVESGVVHDGMTTREAIEAARELSGRETKRHSEADLLVGRLVRLPGDSLSDPARRLLDGWLR